MPRTESRRSSRSPWDDRERFHSASREGRHERADDSRTKERPRYEGRQDPSSKAKRHRSRSESSSPNDRRHKPKQERSNSRERSADVPASKNRKVDKDSETPEEKRARRLAKKLAKAQRQRGRAGSVDVMDDNPFGDPQIHEVFIWGKKLQKEGITDYTLDDIKKQTKEKQEASRAELEKVRQRRLQYERERAAREEEVQMIQREKEAAQFQQWQSQEDGFHLKQAQLRSEIRIRDGRAKPVDLLAKYISSESDLSVDIHEPSTYIEGLKKRDLEDLLEDIAVYQKLDRDLNDDYWNDITIVVNDELQKILASEAELERRAGRQGINAVVSADVGSVFKGKTLPQLRELENQIAEKLVDGQEGVDVSYWENLLQQASAYIARVRLKERHQENLRRKLDELKKEQGIRDEEERLLMPPPKEPVASTSTTNTERHVSDEDEQRIADYDTGQYSPRLIPFDDVDVGMHLIEPEEDKKKLQLAREQVLKTGSAAIVTTEDHVFEREARKGMGEDEAQFSVEAEVDKPFYVWSEKYRPRKPRYFNRVHTGFEWNKYNQTHYDLDNPPPKVVQGYKFNIFYPDLIDKSVTPKYKVTPCNDNSDFAVLKISAGPPYEDIAFKIVNREWEYSYKRGFRCQFHNNIFQLWFHFKRYRYRR
ncbi:LOW QUALITY PROTEIN: splicing factor Cactin-like [Paramacrobiotus metropolitanus]|uniref:LOW QUALITY PROTEIN: splicing factor Cactin-like n=1 Tax=Paramacrobiotus metropolitanus TaxID=2943436 RepID=UPI002445C429|nr:LOW QUALITY PROTEIN: splicing factor Cactin-like [Paramacrobiotus metropolitanus]